MEKRTTCKNLVVILTAAWLTLKIIIFADTTSKIEESAEVELEARKGYAIFYDE